MPAKPHKLFADAQIEKDVNTIAEQVARLTETLDERFAGIRSDCEVLVLQEVNKIHARLDALTIERTEMTDALLKLISGAKDAR